ncbi:MAG: hypothetical protein PF574_01680 [Candidatus Delongbacteria bacterium]|jgi:hypothetical protein|nr:hypothetical protein [Candidatus Delongbacteria bacterium]
MLVKEESFNTALKKKENNEDFEETDLEYWEIGAEINMYKSKSEIFLRTDANEIEKDNLGELSEFLTIKKYFNKS